MLICFRNEVYRLKIPLEYMQNPIRTHRWPNWLFKLTPTLRLVPFSRCAPYGAA
jgi:hypothetical protein